MWWRMSSFDIRTRQNFCFFFREYEWAALGCMNYTAILIPKLFFLPAFCLTYWNMDPGVVRVFICERAYLCECVNEQTGHDCRDTLLQRWDKAVSLSPIKIQHSVVRKKHFHLSLWVHSQFYCSHTHTRTHARCFAGGQDWFAINLLLMSFLIYLLPLTRELYLLFS